MGSFRIFRLCCAAALTVVAGWACDLYPPDAQHDSLYMICLPAAPPTGLVIFAHGYVAPGPVLEIPDDQLHIQGEYIPDIVNSMGLAFAATSYPRNGLAIKEGIADVTRLAQFYAGLHGVPGPVFLVGVSEGGLVTAKALEQAGTVFSGGLALCGPLGDFRRQINWFEDFRVVFDYFFPDRIPGSPVEIPASVMENWPTYQAVIAGALASNPSAASPLFSVTGVPAPPGLEAASALGVLWYNVFATNDARQELGGQPYGNQGRRYDGSLNDVALNRGVERFRADPDAVRQIREFYQTSGRLQAPIVAMHTTGDPVVPFWQELVYLAKVVEAGQLGRYTGLPVSRYGHCSFQAAEVLFGFSTLVGKVTGQAAIANAESALKTGEARSEFRALKRSAGR
jgi:hypothetical protein